MTLADIKKEADRKGCQMISNCCQTVKYPVVTLQTLAGTVEEIPVEKNYVKTDKNFVLYSSDHGAFI